jgi:predicted dehydrogenase
MVPFEFEWMRWIFGPVEEVQCIYSKQLDLPTDIDDAYSILARFRSGLLATILIEVIDRSAVREGRLISQAGTISWDFASLRLRHYDGNARIFQEEKTGEKSQEQKAGEKRLDIEEMYVAEVAAFLKACRGEERWSHSYRDDQELSQILLACERSSNSGQRVRVEDVA